MGSIETPKPLVASFPFLVNAPAPEYDPWELPYGKAPEHLKDGKSVTSVLPLKDFRDDVLTNYSLSKSRDFLRKNGFTVVKHNTSLLSPSYKGSTHFLDAELVDSVYYAEIRQLVQEVTGCRQVFITDSLARRSGADRAMVTLKSWEKKTVNEDAPKSIHLKTPTAPARIPHWDYSPLGARQTIRNWSTEITAHAEKLGIIAREDEICGDKSATEEESNPIIDENYNGPRYACFSVWRPLTPVTRDPLALAPYRTVEAAEDMIVVPHVIKQPGTRGDWLRDLATLRVREDAAEEASSHPGKGLEWHYVSDQNVDEVLIIKAFDSAALPGQAKVTGEERAAVHLSPDIGEAGYGGPRESIEVRLVAFW